MDGQQMPTAELAELAVALLRLVVDADIVLALGDFHGAGLPQRECVDGRRRPAATGRAVTESRCDGFAGHSEFNRAAETASLVSRVHHRCSVESACVARACMSNAGWRDSIIG